MIIIIPIGLIIRLFQLCAACIAERRARRKLERAQKEIEEGKEPLIPAPETPVIVTVAPQPYGSTT